MLNTENEKQEAIASKKNLGKRITTTTFTISVVLFLILSAIPSTVSAEGPDSDGDMIADMFEQSGNCWILMDEDTGGGEVLSADGIHIKNIPTPLSPENPIRIKIFASEFHPYEEDGFTLMIEHQGEPIIRDITVSNYGKDSYYYVIDDFIIMGDSFDVHVGVNPQSFPVIYPPYIGSVLVESKLDAFNPDCDMDGIFDGLEVHIPPVPMPPPNLLMDQTPHAFQIGNDWYDKYYGGTYPLNPDSDADGLPDGGIDGWYYNRDPSKDYLDRWYMKIDNNPYLNGIIDPWEGEDHNFNGVYEEGLGETQAWSYDGDLDQMPDGWEVFWENKYPEIEGPNPHIADSLSDVDLDDLNNYQEYLRDSNPCDPDDDGDGLNDGDEENEGTSWYDRDSDDDGILDGEEVFTTTTNPTNPDHDGDDLPDGLEVGKTDPILGDGFILGTYTGSGSPFIEDEDPSTTTNPKNDDTDGDDLPDGIEDKDHNGKVKTFQGDTVECDPNDDDTDDDNLKDGEEDSDHNGLINPAYESNPMRSDTDGDSIQDDLEGYGYYDQHDVWQPGNIWADGDNDNVCNAFDDDSDNDGLDDDEEVSTSYFGGSINRVFESNPIRKDSDEDGIDDINEGMGVPGQGPHTRFGDNIFCNAYTVDCDNDGLWDGEEDTNNNQIYDDGLETNPFNEDTDGDGYYDGDEYNYGTDPLNPLDPGFDISTIDFDWNYNSINIAAFESRGCGGYSLASEEFEISIEEISFDLFEISKAQIFGGYYNIFPAFLKDYIEDAVSFSANFDVGFSLLIKFRFDFHLETDLDLSVKHDSWFNELAAIESNEAFTYFYAMYPELTLNYMTLYAGIIITHFEVEFALDYDVSCGIDYTLPYPFSYLSIDKSVSTGPQSMGRSFTASSAQLDQINTNFLRFKILDVEDIGFTISSDNSIGTGLLFSTPIHGASASLPSSPVDIGDENNLGGMLFVSPSVTIWSQAQFVGVIEEKVTMMVGDTEIGSFLLKNDQGNANVMKKKINLTEYGLSAGDDVRFIHSDFKYEIRPQLLYGWEVDPYFSIDLDYIFQPDQYVLSIGSTIVNALIDLFWPDPEPIPEIRGFDLAFLNDVGRRTDIFPEVVFDWDFLALNSENKVELPSLFSEEFDDTFEQEMTIKSGTMKRITFKDDLIDKNFNLDHIFSVGDVYFETDINGNYGLELINSPVLYAAYEEKSDGSYEYGISADGFHDGTENMLDSEFSIEFDQTISTGERTFFIPTGFGTYVEIPISGIWIEIGAKFYKDTVDNKWKLTIDGIEDTFIFGDDFEPIVTASVPIPIPGTPIVINLGFTFIFDESFNIINGEPTIGDIEGNPFEWETTPICSLIVDIKLSIGSEKYTGFEYFMYLGFVRFDEIMKGKGKITTQFSNTGAQDVVGSTGDLLLTTVSSGESTRLYPKSGVDQITAKVDDFEYIITDLELVLRVSAQLYKNTGSSEEYLSGKRDISLNHVQGNLIIGNPQNDEVVLDLPVG